MWHAFCFGGSEGMQTGRRGTRYLRRLGVSSASILFIALGLVASCGGTEESPLPERCRLPGDGGSCVTSVLSYFHNAGTGLCEPFAYSGCGGNDNRFATLSECQAACNGGTPNMDVCTTPADCMLAGSGCCGGCSNADRSAFVALNKKFEREYTRTRGCQSVTCGACATVDELSTTSQYFVSTCQNGQCVVVDIREDAITECQADSECMLRGGSACCEDCDSAQLIAVSSSANISPLLCPVPLPCAKCSSPIAPDFAAACRSNRCTVTRR